MSIKPTNFEKYQKTLKASMMDTPVGPMISIADDETLFILEFADRPRLDPEMERLKLKTHREIISGRTIITDSIEQELSDYFSGKNFTFKTPMHLLGSEFQKNVWRALHTIPPGKTWSYAELARSIHHPKACRAVANANGANQLAIIIPCHRVINTNGGIGGYGGGIARKQWLLDHERNDIMPPKVG